MNAGLFPVVFDHRFARRDASGDVVE